MNKLLIKQRFSKSLKTYDENAIIQKEMAKRLVEFINISEAENILELGCGTGLLTKELIKKLSFEKYTAVDMVEKCEGFINEISKDIKFITADMENLSTDKKYDLIISNASLQWLDDLPSFIKNVIPLLSSKGILAFTTFGGNNYKELKNFIETPLKYFSVDELKKILTDFKQIDIKEDEKILEFNKPSDILYHMKNTGVNAINKTSWTKSDLIKFEQNYQKNNNKKYPLTYHSIYICAKQI